ncbi:MAG: hypothetical protein PHQ43_03610 [Dehalococcoidales bacterium]|nr:hypothetical protein [Dehalococcoidales bacterium]
MAEGKWLTGEEVRQQLGVNPDEYVSTDGKYYVVNGQIQSPGGGGGSSGYPVFDFDWDQAETQALEKLRDYYEWLLEEEGGDVDRAKQRLEQDYERGLRYKREESDIQTERILADTLRRIGYTEEDAIREADRLVSDIERGVGQQREDATREIDWLTKYTFPEERSTLMENLNTRGLLPQGGVEGGLAGKKTQRLEADQAKRQEAIERALKRYEEEAGITKERGLEDIGRTKERAITGEELGQERGVSDIERALRQYEETSGVTKERGLEDLTRAYDRFKRELEEEKKQKATQMAGMTQARDYSKYQAEYARWASQQEPAAEERLAKVFGEYWK